MSKSSGNFITIHELIENWPGAVVRFQMLSSHYRQPMDWRQNASEQTLDTLDGFRQLAEGSQGGEVDPGVLAALLDDLNTPQAIAELHRLAGEARQGRVGAARNLAASCALLGLDLANVVVEAISRQRRGGLDEVRIGTLIAARIAARKGKNFAEADRLRAELDAMGINLMDAKNAGGELVTTWEVKR